MPTHLLLKAVEVSYTLNQQHNLAMESAIGLRFSTLPNQSICVPSGLHLSFSTQSLLSLKSSKNHPNEHIPAAITCMMGGSLRSTYNAVDKGRANMAGASFVGNVRAGTRIINQKCNAAQREVSSLGKGIRSPWMKNINHHLELMEVAKKLEDSKKYDLAVEVLKLHESKVKDDPEATYQVKMEIMHNLYLQEKLPEALQYAEELYEDKEIYAKRFQFEIFYATKLMEMARKLKESQHYDLAVKLLKVHDREVEIDPEASYFVKMELMHILFLQEKYEEAKIYCDELDRNEPIYRTHFNSGLFYALKSGILCGLNQHEDAIKYMHIFNQNRSESTPLLPPCMNESIKPGP